MRGSLATRDTTGTAGVPAHQGSHRHLLDTVHPLPSPGARVDAIVVPTARPTAHMREAVALAAGLNCTLVALCSRDASAERTAELAASAGVALVAVDATRLPPGLLPAFATSALLARTPFARHADTSQKRNTGLLLTRAMGWQRIVFLDDDIAVPRHDVLRDAVALLDRYPAVGLLVDSFPDNSVVCHAHRDVGGSQQTFIGAGALAVGPRSLTSFFPDVYNEDWFFLLDRGLRPAAITGNAVQRGYDPYADPHRARSEEFGDCLAEGLFGLLDAEWRMPEAGAGHWRRFLADRRRFIGRTIDRAQDLDLGPGRRTAITRALLAALDRNHEIPPELFVDYAHALRADRRRWREHVARVKPGARPEQALRDLGLADCSTYTPARRPPS